jgi:signal transduction histidine kinase
VRAVTHEIQVESGVKSVMTHGAAVEGIAPRRRDEFLAVLSHELRTPLQSVMGWVQLLEKDVACDVRERAVDAIKRSTSAMCRIVDDLSDQSRIRTGKLRLSLTVTDMRVLIDEAVTAIRPTAQRRGVHMDAFIPPQLPSIPGDPGRLRQVLSNLLSNAVKFTPPEGSVRVHAQVSGESLRIVVSDTGVGIDEKLLPHLFVRFQQGEEAQARAQGLGLGLSLVKELVERHGGEVMAESAGLGKGSTFTVVLPLGCTTAPDAPRASAPS